MVGLAFPEDPVKQDNVASVVAGFARSGYLERVR